MHKLRRFYNVYGSTGGLLLVLILLTGSLFYVLYGQNISFGTKASKVDVKVAGIAPATHIQSEIQGTDTCSGDPSINSDEQAFVNAVNSYRATQGLGPLTISSQLSKMAQSFADDMASKNYFSGTHTDQAGRTKDVRAGICGVNASSTSEIAAAGQKAAQDTLTQFKNSPEHNAILLDKDLSHTLIGVGQGYNPNSTYKYYWVADLGGSDAAGGGGTGTGTGGGGTTNPGVCGTLCSGTCANGGVTIDGVPHPNGDGTGQCGIAYESSNTPGDWWACTSDRGWLQVAAGSCLNGDIIDSVTGACITNEFIGSPNASDSSNKVCGYGGKEYQCQNGAWNPTGNSCGPNSNGGGTGTGGGGTGTGTGTGTGGGGTGTGGGGTGTGGGGTTQYTLNSTTDKTSYAPGESIFMCYTITPSVAFDATLFESIDGAADFQAGQWQGTGTPNECAELKIDPSAPAGSRKFTIKAGISGQEVAETSASVQITGSNTSPSITATPSASISPSITTTTTPGVTTTPAAGNGNLAFSIKIAGIGSNTGSGENNSPTPNSDNLQVQLIDPNSSQVINTISSTLNYNSGTSSFTGTSQIPTGNYKIKVRTNNSLWNDIGPFILTDGQTATTPDTTLVTGDLNQDNVLDLQDYNIFISCYGNNSCTQKGVADVNQDGKVNDIDLNIFYSGLANRNGD